MQEKRIKLLLWSVPLVVGLLFLIGGMGVLIGRDEAGGSVLSRFSSGPDKTVAASDGRTPAKSMKVPPLKSPNYLKVSGSKIVDAAGKEVRLTGVNWFGMETANFAPHGLWSRNWEDMLDQIAELGFNTIRLPYTNEMFDKGSVPNGISWELNPDLQGLPPLEIMDKIVVGAGERGLKVILDRHRPSSDAQSSLWYTTKYSEERWIADWKMLAARYAGNDTVIGADLHNEPKGEAAWGTADVRTDWRLAAERAGNAILGVNPNLLIIVEGIDNYKGSFYWWGGNLMGAKEFPVRLSSPDKLVYSIHDYGPGVYMQSWFSDKSFPANLPKLWLDNWFYLVKDNIAPIFVGEFGGRSVGSDTEGIWQRSLARFLKDNGISYTYWSFNPNSGDTGGILDDDWKTPISAKMAVLSEYQAPVLGNGAPTKINGKQQAATIPQPKATSTPAASEKVKASGAGADLRVAYRSARVEDKTSDLAIELRVTNHGSSSMDLKDLELRYWFHAEKLEGKRQLLTLDWATIDRAGVRSELIPMPVAGQTHFLRLTFEDRAGSLSSGKTMEIKARVNKDDWSEYSQANDYSFNRAKDFVDWDHVTAYLKGALVWGVEPCS